MAQEAPRRARVVIIGAGFGGLAAARALRKQPVDVLVIDRNNYHLFTPLLYEVATAGLDARDIAQPIRATLRGQRNARVLVAAVHEIDVARKLVRAGSETVEYDYLIVAAGSEPATFGVSGAEAVLQAKELGDGIAVRDRLIACYERASTERDESERRRLMTAVVVGGGPTGVELAGALAELRKHVFARDYPLLDMDEGDVVLVEATDALLGAMPAPLQRSARRQLEELGVRVRLGAPVASVRDDAVVFRDGEELRAGTVIWAAGVRAASLGQLLLGERDRAGRVRVGATLELPGADGVYVIGDLASVDGADGKPLPMLAPVALQGGRHAARNIMRRIARAPQLPFRYTDRGTMATIGRRRAVAHVFGLNVSGSLAWMMWLVLHLVQIISFRNRLLVFVNWVWNYVNYDRANRALVRARDIKRTGDGQELL